MLQLATLYHSNTFRTSSKHQQNDRKRLCRSTLAAYPLHRTISSVVRVRPSHVYICCICPTLHMLSVVKFCDICTEHIEENSTAIQTWFRSKSLTCSASQECSSTETSDGNRSLACAFLRTRRSYSASVSSSFDSNMYSPAHFRPQLGLFQRVGAQPAHRIFSLSSSKIETSKIDPK